MLSLILFTAAGALFLLYLARRRSRFSAED